MSNVSTLSFETVQQKIGNKKVDKRTGKLFGHFAYVKMQKPAPNFDGDGSEYVIDVVVSAAVAKQYKAEGLHKKQIHEIDTSAFKEKMYFEPPYPEQDEQFVIKLKAKAELTKDNDKHGLQKGDPVPYDWPNRPKVYIPVGKANKDVTKSVLVGNGSFGEVAFDVVENKFGTFGILRGVRVTDLIELEKSQGSSSPFGEVLEDEDDEAVDTDDIPF